MLALTISCLGQEQLQCWCWDLEEEGEMNDCCPVSLSSPCALCCPWLPLSAPPVMTYAQLESLINKWSLELEDQEKHFLHQATQVNAWDRMLIENGEKVR